MDYTAAEHYLEQKAISSGAEDVDNCGNLIDNETGPSAQYVKH